MKEKRLSEIISSTVGLAIIFGGGIAYLLGYRAFFPALMILAIYFVLDSLRIKIERMETQRSSGVIKIVQSDSRDLVPEDIEDVHIKWNEDGIVELDKENQE